MSSKLRKPTTNKATEELEVVEIDAVQEVKTAEVVAVEPELSLIDNAVNTSEAVTDAELETVTEVKVEPKVRINPRQDVRTFIGDQWYNLKAGKQVSVPRTVKEKLQKAGLLSPL